MLLHPDIRGYPQTDMVLNSDITPTSLDESIAVRLSKAFRKASEDESKINPSSEVDIWKGLQKGPHAQFFTLLKDENTAPPTRALAAYLCNMARLGVSEGLVQGENQYKKITSNGKYRRWLAGYNTDKLIALAESLGVLPCENPEQGRSGFNILSDLDEIIEKIEGYLQISIIPPDIEGGLYALRTKKGTINDRDIFAIYTANRIRELLKGRSTSHVCEIGAGIGKVAYYAHLLGMKNYTIIDLPYINVLQGFYLIKSLPATNVILYNENSGSKVGAIEILPYWSFDKMADDSFDLTLNQDSFPEINREAVLNYLNHMKRNTKKYFFSVNQESHHIVSQSNFKQNIVSELLKDTGGFERVYRAPFWLRKGYVEEVFGVLK